MSHPGGHRPRPSSSAPGARIRGGVRPALAGLLALVLLAGVAFGLAWESPPPDLAPLEVGWEPARPVQGHLFVVRVANPPGSALVSATGVAGGEELHFEPVDSVLESLAPVPIGATDSIDAWVRATYEDGRSRTDSVRIPVAAVEYEHEQLTVAPRFGSPLSEEDRARLNRDREKAARVAREAHATPRIRGSEVILPRDDRITSGFGTGREFNGRISSRHMGLDLAGDHGDVVTAAAAGVVALADAFLLAGNVVYVNHGGGLLTGYFHLSDWLVEAGDTVSAGTPVGLVGATGRVTGPHLHWVVRYGTTSVDPRSLLELP